jgi:hypothetical protein
MCILPAKRISVVAQPPGRMSLVISMAYLTTYRLTRELAHSALPDAPTVSLQEQSRGRLRRGTSQALHRLADRF